MKRSRLKTERKSLLQREIRQLKIPKWFQNLALIAPDNVRMKITRHTLIRVPWGNLLAHMQMRLLRSLTAVKEERTRDDMGIES